MVYNSLLSFFLHHQPFHPAPSISAPQSKCRSSTAKLLSPRAPFPPHTHTPRCLTDTSLLTLSPLFPVQLINSLCFTQNCMLWFSTCRYLPLLVCPFCVTGIWVYSGILSHQFLLGLELPSLTAALPYFYIVFSCTCSWTHKLLSTSAMVLPSGANCGRWQSLSLCLAPEQLPFDHLLGLLHSQSSLCFSTHATLWS